MKVRRFAQSFASGVLVVALATTNVTAEPLVTNTTRFRIPFTVESTNGRATDGFAVLFGARDGAAMQQLQQVPIATGGFDFAAPADGTWQFAIRMTDTTGRLDESGGPLTPELQVIVDTTAPALNLELLDVGNGTVHVRWQGQEEFSPGALNLKFAEGDDGRWKDVQVPPGTSGHTTIRSRPGTSVAVRAQLGDRAGNTGTVTQEIVLSRAPSIPQPTTQQDNATPQTSPAFNGAPVGPSPFPQMQVPVAPQIPQQKSGYPGSPAAPPATARPVLSSPQTFNSSPAVSGVSAAVSPNQTWQAPAQHTFVSNSAPAIPGQPVIQLVADSVFNVAYTVEDVGPSGVSSVEMFVTEDDGQHWFRYGNDTDLQSPMQVDVQGEGTFGFAIRVRNGVGFIDPPPQPGDRPEITITVDQTAPVVTMTMPQVHVNGTASVHLGWNVLDGQTNGVRLEWAASANGPWVPVFDWQTDRGHFEWPISTNMPHSMYFRLLARDNAGNIGSAQTSQPVLVDLKRPKARVIGVQPVSQNVGY